jgi:hypothetical protein
MTRSIAIGRAALTVIDGGKVAKKAGTETG